jgi:hypothetical protein
MSTSGSNVEPQYSTERKRHAALTALVPTIFAGTLFVSAALLFTIQPMFTRMVLPRLGGAPAVWSVAMVFFQAALLAGYAYAHVLARTLSPGRAALVHMGVLAAAAMTLPICIAAGFDLAPQTWVAPWVVGLFATSIGLPFVALSASAPLLQNWFVATGHARAENPYVLYAASNLGSFVGLIAYPFLIEVVWPLGEQARLWSVGFALLSVLVAACAMTAASGSSAAQWCVPTASCDPAPTARDRLGWIVPAAIPSGLVIAVTAYLTMEVAAAPFLWVVPLALYLLTFVIAFRDRAWLSHDAIVRYTPYLIAPLAISILVRGKVFWLASIGLNLVGFFALALLCHGTLYGRRPKPAHLTEFYLWVSVGGVLGGIFSGLLAPHLFNGTYEYPLLVCAALLMFPGILAGSRRDLLVDTVPPLIIAIAVLAAHFLFDVRTSMSTEVPLQIVLVGLAAWMLMARRRPLRFFAIAVLAFIVAGVWNPGMAPIERVRSFFGVHEVADTADGAHRFLLHGTTIHGVESVRAADGSALVGRPEPLGYYYIGGPYSEAFAAARRAQGRLGEIAIVGLGAGLIACYRQDGENWTFFEIDPEVVRIARDPRLFRSLSQCAPDAAIVTGDARLTLTSSSRRYDLIALDAFTSDSIPVHLLTKEAIAGYLTHLSPHGMIIAHISNRHMDLAPVIAAIGAANGLVVYLRQDGSANDFSKDFRANTELAVLARDAADLGDLPRRPGWRRLSPDPKIPGWTDDSSDLLGAILRRKLGG